MTDEMEEIINEFITEAEESLERIEPLFVELEQKGEDKELLNDIFRSMHTIKGAAGFLGFQPIVDVAHSSENIMKKLRDGELAASKPLMDVILESVDMLRALLDHLKEKDDIEEDVAPLVQKLTDALSAATTEDATLPSDNNDAVSPDESVDEVFDVLPEPSEESIEIVKPVQESSAAGIPEPAALEECAPVQTKKDSPPKVKEGAQNLRVEVSRIDKVMDLAGEVVLVRNRLLNISNYFEQQYNNDEQAEILAETVSFLDRVTSDMQLAVMRMRMQPIKKVLSKFPRLVRDMSASVNKDVDLVISGEGTEVDKTVIEHIGDPLTHILRNSIDHGLEPTEDRIAKGKPAKGRVEINIYQKGNQVVIEILDDGKGMDVEKLKQKAVEKGLITAEEAHKMTDETATDIIFMPGFSTKKQATELSGRGVGMDVVKTNVSLLNGYVEVSTRKDVGTTFKLCIPLTLAIIQTLMVEVSGTKYAIPLTPIEETLMVSKDDIDNVTGQNVIVIRDRVCPLFELTNLLGIDSNGNGNGNGDNDSEKKYIIVISMGDKRFCIAVDRLVGQEEVVIKTLSGLDSSNSHVLGATITGDGKVVFILDVSSISRKMIGIAKGQ
ncbi:MAG: chemotaxis protein CheA [Nitrospiraceae bacterium]|nr:MAG: chemotaxis protein CheA [Nitrospiraceae bacterium]